MKVLNPSRRDSVATKFALLALASLGLIAIATVVRMHGEARSALAIAGLFAYAYFSGRAMQLWQGRGLPTPHRSVWRRHFLHERRETRLPGAKAFPTEQTRSFRKHADV